MLTLTFADWSIDSPQKKSAIKPTTDADYFFENVSIKSFDSNGRKINQVHAKKIEHYIQTQVSQIDTPSLRLISQTGSEWVINSASGKMNLASETVSLTGDVLVSQNPAASVQDTNSMQTQIKTTDLEVDLIANQITTAKPVLISSAGMQTSAEGLKARIDQEALELMGKVKTQGISAKSSENVNE